MPDWSIKIIPVNPSQPNGAATFEPQDKGPGQPLEAWDGDTVTWNNTTGADHWPWPTDANYQPLNVSRGQQAYMSDNIPAGQGSRPTYPVNLGSASPPLLVHYYCKNHPNVESERGIIRVIAIPSP
jgi:hypothetical protein